MKHGALSRPEGRLHVTWSSTDPGEDRLLHIEWRETGVPVETDAPKPKRGGAGRKLIERALPYQLGANVDYRLGRDGLLCRISLPTSRET